MTQHIHLIAICGTAMGTLAGMLKEKGYTVTGSDENVYPPMSEMLAKWGIPILKGFRPENIKPRPDLVIVGNAVSKTNPEVTAMLGAGIPYLSLPQALGRYFLEGKRSLVVTGTHGKTTTTSLLAWVLFDLGLDPSFLVGGIPQNFGASFRLGSGEFFVVEGDEYDTAFFDKGPKFLHYRPERVILTGVEFDHADIYRDLEHLMQSFRRLVELIPPGGRLYLCGDNENALKLKSLARCPVMTYGTEGACDLRAEQIRLGPSGVEFRLMRKNEDLGEFRSPLPGRHNLQNLLGVIAMILGMESSLETNPPNPPFSKGGKMGPPPLKKGDRGGFFHRLQSSILKFEGVRRRQEVRGVVRGVTVIDDFAHHPTAVAETIEAIRRRYPGQKVWAIFEPRSNTSRRAVFQKDFAKALALAGEVILAKVFMPEKVKDAPLLDEKQLAEDIQRLGTPVKEGLEVDEIVEDIVPRVKEGDVLLVMSNGGFGNIHQKLLERLS